MNSKYQRFTFVVLLVVIGIRLGLSGYQQLAVRSECEAEAETSVRVKEQSEPLPRFVDQELVQQGLFAKSDQEEAFKSCLLRHTAQNDGW